MSGLERNAGAAAAFGMGSNNVVTEDQPTMRSVALMGSQPAQLEFSAGPRFGKAPALGLSRPGPLSSFKGEVKRSTSLGLAVRQEWKEVTVTSPWNVTDLEPVPIDFPLERTHREIRGADCNEVANRIAKALCSLSIQAEYDGEQAKAKCTTCDMVSFRIRLFAGGANGMPVMVEVQRRTGSASSFMRSCRAILDAAEGKDVSGVAHQAKKLPSFMKGPVGSMKCLSMAVAKADPIADMNAGFDKAAEMLRSQLRDVNLLALENLGQMTDAIKTRPDIALKVSKKVILAEDSDIRDEVAVMLQKDTFSHDDEERTPSEIVEKSRQQALILFSNSLALVSKDGSLLAAVKSQAWFSDFLIPSLLDELKSFSTSSNNAYEAACSLTSLASCSDVARRLMLENSAVEDLRAAMEYGRINHELLANESVRCLEAMGDSA